MNDYFIAWLQRGDSMKWLDNLASIKQLHKAGKCPYSGQENTDYRLLEISSGKGYGDVWCNDCKKAFHISRIEVSETDIREKQLPPELKY